MFDFTVNLLYIKCNQFESNIVHDLSQLLIFMLSKGSGSGQTVYVIDTGIRHSHDDYGGRASYHWDYQSSVSIHCYRVQYMLLKPM